MSKKDNSLTYELAYAELSKILQDLQSQDISLEKMTSGLRRARELVQYCRDQLYLTELELDSMLADEEE
jgi:exodeoxyribonuclease VII small subunit